MVGVAVRERVGADDVAPQGLDEALRRALGARVHDDVAEQVRVDPVARRERDVEDVLGDAADRHGGSGDLYRPPMPDEPVLTERRDGVLLITLNRPDARNAVNLALAEGVAGALDELDADGAVAVGVVTGAGAGFCAGMDLKAFVTGERPWVGDRGFAGIVQRASRKPLIAAIEGFAVAGGLEVALACDLIVAAQRREARHPRGQALARRRRRRAHAPAAARAVRRGDGAGPHGRHHHRRSAATSWGSSTAWPSAAGRSTRRSSSPAPSRPTARSRSTPPRPSSSSSSTGARRSSGSARASCRGRSSPPRTRARAPSPSPRSATRSGGVARSNLPACPLRRPRCRPRRRARAARSWSSSRRSCSPSCWPRSTGRSSPPRCRPSPPSSAASTSSPGSSPATCWPRRSRRRSTASSATSTGASASSRRRSSSSSSGRRCADQAQGDGRAHRLPHGAGPRRRRAHRPRAGDHRRRRLAARPRPLPGHLRRGLRDQQRRRAADRRLPGRQRLVALDLLRQPADRDRRAGGDRGRPARAGAAARSAHRRARDDPAQPGRRLLRAGHEPGRPDLRLGLVADRRARRRHRRVPPRCSSRSSGARPSRSCR